MAHLATPKFFGLQNDPERAMHLPVEIAKIPLAYALLNRYDGSQGTVAELALNIMRNAQFSLIKYDKLPRKLGVAEGDEDCFTWDERKNIIDKERPFPVVFDSMSNPSRVDYRGAALDPDSKKTTWQTLPWWFLELTGKDDWEAIRDEWKEGVLPLAFQAYLLLSQEYLFTSANYTYKQSYREKGETKYDTFTAPNDLYLAYRNYTEVGYEYMNHALRINPRYDREMCLVASQVNELELLQWIIALMPMTIAPIKVYRYSQLTPELNNAVEGDVLTFRGYTSVTMNLVNTINIVNLLAGDSLINRDDPIHEYYSKPKQRNMVLIEMLIPEDSQLLVVPSPENELILPHYCQFEVVQKMQITDLITYMYLQLVNDPTACTRANF